MDFQSCHSPAILNTDHNDESDDGVFSTTVSRGSPQRRTSRTSQCFPYKTCSQRVVGIRFEEVESGPYVSPEDRPYDTGCTRDTTIELYVYPSGVVRSLWLVESGRTLYRLYDFPDNVWDRRGLETSGYRDHDTKTVEGWVPETCTPSGDLSVGVEKYRVEEGGK